LAVIETVAFISSLEQKSKLMGFWTVSIVRDSKDSKGVVLLYLTKETDPLSET
jgi:hypothetical protein